MRTVDPSSLTWRTSSYSGGEGQNGDCVQVAVTDHAVAVRDSKHPAGGILVVPSAAWRGFLAYLARP